MTLHDEALLAARRRLADASDDRVRARARLDGVCVCVCVCVCVRACVRASVQMRVHVRDCVHICL